MALATVAAPVAAGAAASPSVDVTQDDGVTVTVTNGTSDDGAAVGNATVDVATVSENVSYAGAGTYETGSNGTVALPAPERDVNVSITASFDGASATTTAALTADANGTAMPFGLRLVGFMAGLNDTEGPRGLAIASWVTANNPGNGSGPPDHAGPGNQTRGPPDHAGGNQNGNETRGPPDHAGGDGAGDGNESGNESGGPPDHAGGGGGAGDDASDGGGSDDGDSGDGNGNDGNGNGGNGANGKDR